MPRKVLICTFHALGVRLLREDGQVLGLKQQFSILDTDDITSLLKDCGGTTDANTARGWQWAISSWKSAGLTSAEALKLAKDENERVTATIMARYEERLTAYQSVDFDDLISLPLKLLGQHEEVREKWQKKLGHVLVDEYQDTNATQYELLKLLVGERARFTAVGDDDQSIYGWRGATLDNLKKLPIDFPQLRVIKLEQNYRSTSAILRAANNVIGPQPQAVPQDPVERPRRGRAGARGGRRQRRARSRARGGAHPEPARELTAQGVARLRHPLPRQPHGALIRAVAAPRQHPLQGLGRSELFSTRPRSAISAPGCGCWSTTTTTRRSCVRRPHPSGASATPRWGSWAPLPRSTSSACSTPCFRTSLPSAVNSRAIHTLHEFGRAVNDLEYRARHTIGHEAARTFLTDWLKDIAYEQHLYDSEENEKIAAARWTNVMDFCDWVAGRCGGKMEDDGAGVQVETERKSLLEVVQTIALISTLSDREQDQNVVTLSTLHASKGLEWPHVTLVGVNEGLLPFKTDDADSDLNAELLALRVQEERRLMYVGITRAQRTLAVSWLKRRKKGRESVPGTTQPLHQGNGAGPGHRERRPAREAARAAGRVRATRRQRPQAGGTMRPLALVLALTLPFVLAPTVGAQTATTPPPSPQCPSADDLTPGRSVRPVATQLVAGRGQGGRASLHRRSDVRPAPRVRGQRAGAPAALGTGGRSGGGSVRRRDRRRVQP